MSDTNITISVQMFEDMAARIRAELTGGQKDE